MSDREYPFPLLLPSLVRQGHYQYPETDVYPSLLCSFPPFYYINAHLNKIAFKHYTKVSCTTYSIGHICGAYITIVTDEILVHLF